MPDGQQTIYLADYTPPGHLITSTHLTFHLAPNSTRVLSRIQFTPNPERPGAPFTLHGENLTLISAKIDGQDITPTFENGLLTCATPNAPFVWDAEVEIDPAANTELEGLYMSNGMYCTQCEAEGFRKITYYPDRPDVMAPFTVRVEADLPVLLSNGNPTAAGPGWAEWHDPWPKPAYLFALVAGDLVTLSDHFTTRSGRDVALNIYVRPADADKCTFAMQALKRAMTWDEDVYSREYDLDIFNIVAVDDFSAGAMENKGLNIFNSSAVLAHPSTTTDSTYEMIEAIIAHEYFHNWTGNRITCRDWFQLCLKEGLTVFRDQQFTGDMRSEPVRRINDAIRLRTHQYREDAGPLAHPVRPNSFVEINNFYTATVYEKGAEVIAMLKRLVGDAAYARALTLYFDRHDGQAATIEDWLQVFTDTTGRDLTQFALWYSQAGTPHLHVTETWDAGTLTLTFRQSHPTQPTNAPMLIPVTLGLIAPDGTEALPSQTIELTQTEQVHHISGLTSRPTASILRDFSAPVILDHPQSAADLAHLLAHDTDPFNRWNAAQTLTRDVLADMILSNATPPDSYTAAIDTALANTQLDPAFRALLLALPAQSATAQHLSDLGHTPNPDAIHTAHHTLKLTLAAALAPRLAGLHTTHQITGPYSPDAAPAGHRSLANAALALITFTDHGTTAAQQFATADNMTTSLAALTCLLRANTGDAALKTFAQRWQDDRQVTDKWFALAITCAPPHTALTTAKSLTQHPAFDLRNPNRARAVLHSFASYQPAFHQADGAGYAFIADHIIALDRLTPQTAAGLAGAFQTLSLWDDSRQSLMRSQLTRILQTPGLSGDTTEIISRILN